MGLMLALMQLSALSLWGMWCYQAGPFVSETPFHRKKAF